MVNENGNKCDMKLYGKLKIDCKRCFGFCCVALYFSASEGFPTDKESGKPCINLQSDFNCVIHKNLRNKGLKGCTAYDCFGAGQKVAQGTYNGHDWRQFPDLAKQMFDVFLIMTQLHEMLWYLTEALILQMKSPIHNDLINMINEIERLTYLNADSLMELDLTVYREKINPLLQKTSELEQAEVNKGKRNILKRRKTIAGRLDLIGVDLRKTNMRAINLRGAFLIAADLRGVDLTGANLIGADLRDADIRGANLSRSLFITQSQINTAKGDSNTKIPIALVRPGYWDD